MDILSFPDANSISYFAAELYLIIDELKIISIFTYYISSSAALIIVLPGAWTVFANYGPGQFLHIFVPVASINNKREMAVLEVTLDVIPVF